MHHQFYIYIPATPHDINCLEGALGCLYQLGFRYTGSGTDGKRFDVSIEREGKEKEANRREIEAVCEKFKVNILSLHDQDY
jgi:hypothetical protein